MKRFLLSLLLPTMVGSTASATVRPLRPTRLPARPAPIARLVQARPGIVIPKPVLAPNDVGAPTVVRARTPIRRWHVRRSTAVVIVQDYPYWSRSWWSPKWGTWFRYDPTTAAYYYYEPALGYYLPIESITFYRQPLASPLSDPKPNPDVLAGALPPPPVEP
jgi:hypothetical protein